MPRLKKRLPKYSRACQRVLDFTPDQFVAAVRQGVEPDLLSDEDDARLTTEERAAILRQCVNWLAGYSQAIKDERNKNV